MPTASQSIVGVLALASYAGRADGFACRAAGRSFAQRTKALEKGCRSSIETCRRGGVIRMATEQEQEKEAPAAAVTGEAVQDELGDDKIIYDPRSGRFFEKKIEEVCREEYCAIDETTGKPILLTLAEKERIFMDAIQSFYYNKRQMLDDDDFDKLKEDLAWEGSKLVLMSRDERLFMNAMAAYGRGERIINDEEFDRLKASLRESGSPVAVSKEPKCYIDSGICTVTFQEDNIRRFATYLPANFIFGLALLGVTYQIIEPIRFINPLVMLAILSAPTIAISKSFTDACLYQNEGKIASGPCPSCGKSNQVYFGNILGVEGSKDEAEFKCPACSETIKIRREDLRARTLPKV